MRRLTLILGLLILVPFLTADDTELFKVSVPPYSMIIIDYSGSMCWTPDGDSTANIYPCNTYGLPKCPVSQSKYGIMRDVMFDLLDADDDLDIDVDDENKLGVPLGFLRYCGYGGVGGDLYSRYYYVIRDIGDHYSDIWDAIWTPVSYGGTPMNEALNRANKPQWNMESVRWYFENQAIPNDPARHCRQYAVILLTDGEDTYDCGGGGGSGSSSRRRASVHAAWRLHQLCPDSLQQDSIVVYVVGLGANLSNYLQNTLNWMAYYGGSDNPLEPNGGNPGGYTTPTDSCSGTVDPGSRSLSGYAFIAEDAQELAQAIKTIFEAVSNMNFNFSSVGVPSVISERFSSDSSAFIGSFLPTRGGFWEGHLYKVKLDTSLMPSDTIWDAGSILQTTNPDLRDIYTFKNGSLQDFDTSNGNLTPADFGVATVAEKNAIINSVRRLPGDWKLGDVFHSSPLYVGAPVPFFYDVGYQGFIRLRQNRQQIVYVGTNDGMLHAIDAVNGDEEFGYIPPDLLPYLKSMALLDSHRYYVDASPIAYGVWNDINSDGLKDSTEWQTWLIGGERRGGNTYYYMDITTNTMANNPMSISDSLLGETWSIPVVSRIQYNKSSHLAERWFFCFGGGYDTTATNMSRSFYLRDLVGDRLGGNNSFGTIRFDQTNTPGLDYCIPSSPAICDMFDYNRPADIYPDGYADEIYVGDHGSNMWLVDIKDTIIANWRMAKVFNSTNPTDLHCFFAPSLALQSIQRTSGDTLVIMEKIPWLFWGTGDRANPIDTIVVNRFYALRYPDTSNVPTEIDLDDLTGGGVPDTANHGWFIRLEPGEKVVSTPLVFHENVFFTTFKPEPAQTQDPCQPAVGRSFIYGMNAWTSYGFWGGVRRQEIAVPGLPPQPKIVIGENTVKIILPGQVVEIPGPKVKIRYPSWESTR